MSLEIQDKSRCSRLYVDMIEKINNICNSFNSIVT